MKRQYRAAVITASDKASRGERADASGPRVAAMLAEAGYRVLSVAVLPDERAVLSEAMRALCDDRSADLVVTTGGTGFAPRDCMPEATLDIAERIAPGIAEAMRAHSMTITGKAMLSRAVAAIRGGTLVINLPGSPRGATENLACVLPFLAHGLDILTESDGECAST